MSARFLMLLVVLAASACGAATPAVRAHRDEPIEDGGTSDQTAEDMAVIDETAVREDAATPAEPAEPAEGSDIVAAPPAVTEVDPAAPDADRTALLRLGRRAYARVCEECHEDGPRLTGRRFPAARLRQQVRQGGARMPAISPARLSDRDLDGLVVFLGGR